MSHQDKKYKTTFENRCVVLADIWEDKKEEPIELSAFLGSSDLGFPLAALILEQTVTITPKVETAINETFDLLCEAHELDPSEVEVESYNDFFK
jgi:hypothetical protein